MGFNDDDTGDIVNVLVNDTDVNDDEIVNALDNDKDDNDNDDDTGDTVSGYTTFTGMFMTMMMIQ